MKTKLFGFFLLIPLFAGCDLIKDAATITISTELTADIPVIVPSSGSKSLEQIIVTGFSKSQDLTLASNADLEPYLSKIKEITLNSLLVVINGLSGSQTINSISLDVAGVGNIFTQTNITMTNNTFTPVISSGTFDLVAAKLTNDLMITLTVSGTVSEPMTFTVSLNFEGDVIANVL